MEEALPSVTNGQSALAIAPMALDAVVGCGGTLARLTAGGVRIVYLVVYDSRVWDDRVRRACRVLGIAPGDLRSLRLEAGMPPERVRARVRQALSDVIATTDPPLVFLPSLHSRDPMDACVAQEAAAVLRGRTLLAYARASGSASALRPLVLTLTKAQAHRKRRAMRPRRFRPGALAPGAPQQAVEVLDVVEWHSDPTFPLDEVRNLASAG